jgi:hypothetical protein
MLFLGLLALGQSPTQITKLSNVVEETSGLLHYKGSFYTFNDSGGEPELYKLDTVSGEVVETIVVSNAKNKDWEAITSDANYIYIGDIGNNKGKRKDLTIYKCPINGLEIGELNAEKITIAYEDQNEFDNKSHEHEYDAEGLFVMDNQLYLISKNWVKDESKIYSVPNEPGDYVLTKQSKILVYGKVTDAFYSDETDGLWLIGYGDARFITFLKGFDGKTITEEVTIPITSLHGLQTEGIVVVDGTVYYTSEEVKMFKADISRFYTKSFEDWVNVIDKGSKLKVSSKQKIATIILEKENGKNLEKIKDVNSKSKTISLEDITTQEAVYIKVKLKNGVEYRALLNP